MLKVELVYFGSCPNVERARDAIRAGGVTDLVEVNQDQLEDNDFRKKFSSPTIVLDGDIVAGSSDGGSACSIIDWQSVSKAITKKVALGRSGA